MYFCGPARGMSLRSVATQPSGLQGDVSCDFPIITRACCFLCAYLSYVFVTETHREIYFKLNGHRDGGEGRGEQISNVKLMLCICQSGPFSYDSVPMYPDWMPDALYASHPNIIRAKPTMWFRLRM